MWQKISVIIVQKCQQVSTKYGFINTHVNYVLGGHIENILILDNESIKYNYLNSKYPRSKNIYEFFPTILKIMQ